MTSVLRLGGVALIACRAAAPGSRRVPHPDDASKQVEYFVAQPPGPGPWPTVVLLHGHQDGLGPGGLLGGTPGGRQFVDWGVLTQLARRGYLAVAVSQPGYGRSSGPADFAGPFTQHAVAGVLTRLRAEGRIAPRRLVLEGVSRGALVAGLVGACDSTVSGLVLISGAYDLTAYVRDARDPAAGPAQQAVVRALTAETGGSPAALRARSVLPVAGAIRAATLVLSGAQDARTSAAQAQELAAAIVRAGGRARAVVYPAFGHQLPVAVRNAAVDPFIDSVLRARTP